MEQLSKVNFDTLGRWALGASLLQGIGVLSRKKGFEVVALPFYFGTLHQFIQPLCQQKDQAFVSHAMIGYSFSSLITASAIRYSFKENKELPISVKVAHSANEMVVLAAFVTTVVAIIFATEGRKLCIAAATIQALCYMNRFYHDTPHIINESTSHNSLPEGIFDVTALMKGKKSVYLGREDFVADVLGVLRSNFETNNPLLVGPAGSGKTELIHYLAVEINEGRLQGFEGWKVYKTNCKELVSNTKYLGELPKKINEIFSYLKGKKAILFIDEIHQALSDGRSTHSPDSSIAEGLLTHLTDPDIRVITATTFDHYPKLSTNEPFLQRFYFQPMPRMTTELRERILSDRLARLQGDFPGVNIPENYENLLIQCLESKGGRRGLRALIALLSVVVEQMHRKKISFEEALQQDIERRLEMEVGVLESKGFIASDQFIENLKNKAATSREFGKEFRVLHLVLKEHKKQREERDLDKFLDRVPSLAH